MSAQRNSFSISFEREGGTVVVRVGGELEVDSAPQFEHGLTGLIDGQGNLDIRVDLGGVSFIDSTGLTALVRALKQVRGRGGDLVLANPVPSVLRVLDLGGLTALFSITTGQTTAAAPVKL